MRINVTEWNFPMITGRNLHSSARCCGERVVAAWWWMLFLVKISAQVGISTSALWSFLLCLEQLKSQQTKNTVTRCVQPRRPTTDGWWEVTVFTIWNHDTKEVPRCVYYIHCVLCTVTIVWSVDICNSGTTMGKQLQCPATAFYTYSFFSFLIWFVL